MNPDLARRIKRTATGIAAQFAIIPDVGTQLENIIISSKVA
jgi:hypothetical protein